jgi:hypothetical protein
MGAKKKGRGGYKKAEYIKIHIFMDLLLALCTGRISFLDTKAFYIRFVLIQPKYIQINKE